MTGTGRRLLLAALIVTLTSPVVACATTGDVERIEARVAVLERHREALERTMAEDVERIEKLHAMITEAEQTLRKSGANLGIRLELLEGLIPKQQGDLEASMVRLKRMEGDLDVIKRELADRLGSTAFFLPSDLPKDKEGMWKAGESAAKAGNVREAQAIFELFEASFPDDPLAPRAFLEVARAMEANGDTDEAIRYYQRVFDRHKASPEAPGAVLRIAEIYVIKGDCTRARSILKFVIDEFRNTDAAKTARARTKTLSRDCKR